MNAEYDYTTSKWFAMHPLAQSTVCQCKKCGLYFKPILGHKCKEGNSEKAKKEKESKENS